MKLWFASPAEFALEQAGGDCLSILSESERSRLDRIRDSPSRQEFLIAHCLVRRALSHCCNAIGAESWRFRTNEYGKPQVEQACGLRFNLSHSLELAVCAVTRGCEVGVDTEHIARAAEILEIAGDVFSPLELLQLENLGSAEKLDRTLSLWILKEAYIKARGIGLSMPLKSFSFVFGEPHGIRLQQNDGFENETKRWRFCLFEHRGHRIAVVVENAGALNVELWEMQPVLKAPRQLAFRELTWYPLSTASS